jgi:hypothetical protein
VADWSGLTTARDWERKEAERTAMLTQELDLIQQRECLRNEVVSELLAGRIDLVTAATHFHRTYQFQRCIEDELRRRWPDASPAERTSRHLIQWVEDGLYPLLSPSERPGALAMLRQMLEDYLRVHGTIVWPPNPWGRSGDGPSV